MQYKITDSGDTKIVSLEDMVKFKMANLHRLEEISISESHEDSDGYIASLSDIDRASLYRGEVKICRSKDLGYYLKSIKEEEKHYTDRLQTRDAKIRDAFRGAVFCFEKEISKILSEDLDVTDAEIESLFSRFTIIAK